MVLLSASTKLTVELFAVNLRTPSHMEWTLDGRLLVSEHTAGTVKDITEGGDFKDVEPFAYGLKGPASILPLKNGEIFVSEMYGDRITNISTGGNASGYNPLTDEVRSPYGLSQFDNRIFVVERSPRPGLNQISDLTNANNKKVFVSNIPGKSLQGLEGLTPYELWPDKWQDVAMGCSDWVTPVSTNDGDYLVVTCSPLSELLKIPVDGGDYFELADKGNILATGLGWSGGLIQHPKNGIVYVTQPKEGTIMAIDPNEQRDYRFEPPVVKGINTPSCVRFNSQGDEMYICSMPTGSIWRVSNF